MTQTTEASGTGRYAIYFVPEPDDPWWTFGTRWLGRDPASGQRLARLEIAGVDKPAWERMTEAPRFYGFHATLKPPFTLAAGCRVVDLLSQARTFARSRSGFDLPGLDVASLGNFIALRPVDGDATINDLAEASVRHFDWLRAPLPAAEHAQRMGAGLTARQQELLLQWGYPYLLDQFRFHMSLTGPLAPEEREAVVVSLRKASTHAMGRPVPVTGMCIYHQPVRRRPFLLRWRVRWGGEIESLDAGDVLPG